MLLTPDEVLARLQAPAATASLQMGRELEKRHRLHIEGDKALLWQFLLACRPDELIAQEQYDELKKIIKPATRPVYSSLLNVLGKTLTAAGTTRYFDFARPQLLEDWQQYCKDYAAQGLFRTLEKKWFSAANTGFQGVFLVDLPADTDSTGLPRPFFRYVPSGAIYDIEVADEALVYLVLQEEAGDGEMDFYCFDARYCHRARKTSKGYEYRASETTEHGLGYVPARLVTSKQAELHRPAVRTSYVAESMELADVYLVDFNNLQWAKRYHSFQKFWSYGVKCEHVEPGNTEVAPVACVGGHLQYESGKVKCPVCKGRGRYVPVGPDKTYIVQVPNQGDPTITPPAGYIRPELDSPRFIAEELRANEGRIEKAVLGKEGILTMQTKVETAAGKDQDMGPVYDRLGAVSEDLEGMEQFIYGTMCRLRYGSAFRDLQNTRGRRYQVKSVAQLEADYGNAKKQGLDEASLYPYLEDIIYTKWAGDPMELERNLLKLQLTPFPTCTIAEARADGVATATDLALKRYLNDFVVRFEEENGSILEFGSVLAPAEKLKRIRAQFSLYLTDIAQRSPVFTLMPPLNAPAAAPSAAPAFAVGDAVMVKQGMAHMPAHEGLSLTIAQVQGDTYAVKLPDGTVHKWYTTDELMGMSPANKPAKAPEMAM